MQQDIYLSPRECSINLGISSTSFQEIKNRFGFKGRVTIEQFNEIEKVVKDIRKRCDKVTLWTINWYWKRYMHEV